MVGLSWASSRGDGPSVATASAVQPSIITKPTTNHRRREAGLALARPLAPERRSEIARKAVERRFEHNCPY